LVPEKPDNDTTREINELKKIIQERDERIKELECLYTLSHVIQDENLPLKEIVKRTAELIPPAWQYPETTCARIVLGAEEYTTDNFRKTAWKQVGSIVIQGKQHGVVEVYYLTEKPEADEGPFLNEERRLIDLIAEIMGKVSEHKRDREAVRESERLFRTLIENSLTGISIIQDNQVVYQNQEQEQILGPLPRPYKFHDFEDIHPEDAGKLKQFLVAITAGKIEKFDTDFRMVSSKNSRAADALKWIVCRASTISYQGEKALLFNFMDITRVKELEKLVTIQDRMSSLGRVAAGIAHEIRNPLSGINIYINSLEKMYTGNVKPETIEKIFRQINAASAKIESIIKRVLDFSSPGHPKLMLSDINNPIREAINLASVSLRKSDIILKHDLASDIPPCKADPQLIEEVMLNFITNAAEAMKHVDSEKILSITTAKTGKSIVISIADSGPGIPEFLHDKIFDPFYTTKKGSSGIGLSICHRIITDHGWTVETGVSVFNGAEFRILIPLHNGNQGH